MQGGDYVGVLLLLGVGTWESLREKWLTCVLLRQAKRSSIYFDTSGGIGCGVKAASSASFSIGGPSNLNAHWKIPILGIT